MESSDWQLNTEFPIPKKIIYDSVATLLGEFFYFHNFGGLLN